MAVGMVTGEYSPGVHGPVLRWGLCSGLLYMDYARPQSRFGQATCLV
jgi:hypothetical protein